MNRFKQVDILRALAVFLVMGCHMEPCPSDVSAFLHRFTTILGCGGWVGVDLFFVLSGFLVSGLLFREYEKHHEIKIGRFFIRRGLKIYPPFWTLIGTGVFVGFLLHQQLSVSRLVTELLFLQSYLPHMFGHTWSLAVEEHFYLLLGIGIFMLTRRKSSEPFRLIPAICVVLSLLCLAFRIYGYYSSPFNDRTHVFPTHLRLDSLFFGVFLSYEYHRHPTVFLSIARRFRYVLAGAGVLLLAPAFCFPLPTPFIFTFGFTLFYLGSGCLLIAALGAASPASHFGRALAFTGSHSYSVYLWHIPVLMWGTGFVCRLISGQSEHGNYNWYVYAITYFFEALGLGIGMATLIEFPVLRIRDRFFPSRGAPLSRAG